MTETAQWREVLKGKVYALYVYEHHRVAIAQMMDDTNSWIVTMPDDQTVRHSAKSQEDAFKLGKKISVQWLQGAIKQLGSVTNEIRNMTASEVQANVKARKQGFTKM